MKKQFLIVNAINKSFHVIDLQLIESISQREGKENKSEIKIISNESYHLYSTDTPFEIFEKIKLLQQESCECDSNRDLATSTYLVCKKCDKKL